MVPEVVSADMAQRRAAPAEEREVVVVVTTVVVVAAAEASEVFFSGPASRAGFSDLRLCVVVLVLIQC